MKTFAFYISEYGYGHATRCIALMREMLQTREDIRIIVCHSFALQFIRESLTGYEDRLIFHDVKTDIGYVLKENTLELDVEQLQRAYGEFCAKLPGKINEEVSFLKPFYVDCIVSDISPIAFEVGDRLGVPSVGISNFTWYTAYEHILPKESLEVFKSMYNKMDYFYVLAGSKERKWGESKTLLFNFYGRKVDLLEVSKIRRDLDPTGKKKIIFISLGMKIDIGDITELPLWNNKDLLFVVSNNMNVHHQNVYKIPHNYTESQNYVATADCIISKAGWGTVGEAIVHGKPLVILERKGMNEDQNTISFLRHNQLCELIIWEELQYVNLYKYIKKVPLKYQNEVSNITTHILKPKYKRCINVSEKEGIIVG
ncbi:glycosyltransferase [Bacillus mycoides]|uniref:glycosyltransferase n=1 Tax=Bacillus mycoides TaxID=1405 RepID=UPI0011A738CC|nr:glycosyltransferase [Bacillus mycoides]